MESILRRLDIQHLYPTIHMLLESVASTIFESNDDTVSTAALSDFDIQPALDLGVLIQADNAIRFAHPALLREYIVRHSATVISGAWENVEAFAATLAATERRGQRFGSPQELGGDILRVLAKEDGRDIVGRFGEIATAATDDSGRNDLWLLYIPFYEALPDLHIDPQSLVQTLELILQAENNNGIGGLIYEAVERTAAQSYERAAALYEAIQSHPDDQVAALSIYALRGLSLLDIAEAHRVAMELTASNRLILCRSGIVTLGSLVYPSEQNDLFLEMLARLELLRQQDNPSINDVLAQAYGNLLPKTNVAQQALFRLSTKPNPIVQYQVAIVLFRSSKELGREIWFQQAFLNLAIVASNHGGTINYLDYCAVDLLKSVPEVVSSFIDAFVLNREYGTEGDEAKLAKLLDSTFAELYRNHQLVLETLLTRWLATNDRRLHRAARDVIMDVRIRRGPPLRLSRAVLNSLDEYHVHIVVQRILGHIVTGLPLAALLLSVVQREPCPTTLHEHITSALGDYVLYNYPGEVSVYLQSRISSDDTPPIERTVAQEALDRAKGYMQARAELRPLKELQPPSYHIYLLRLARNEQQTSMMEAIREGSIFSSLVHRVPLKYGNGLFFERDGTFSEPSSLSRFEHGMELPRGELIDPIGQAYQRLQWQSAGFDPSTSSAEDLTQGE